MAVAEIFQIVVNPRSHSYSGAASSDDLVVFGGPELAHIQAVIGKALVDWHDELRGSAPEETLQQLHHSSTLNLVAGFRFDVLQRGKLTESGHKKTRRDEESQGAAASGWHFYPGSNEATFPPRRRFENNLNCPFAGNQEALDHWGNVSQSESELHSRAQLAANQRSRFSENPKCGSCDHSVTCCEVTVVGWVQVHVILQRFHFQSVCTKFKAHLKEIAPELTSKPSNFALSEQLIQLTLMLCKKAMGSICDYHETPFLTVKNLKI